MSFVPRFVAVGLVLLALSPTLGACGGSDSESEATVGAKSKDTPAQREAKRIHEEVALAESEEQANEERRTRVKAAREQREKKEAQRKAAAKKAKAKQEELTSGVNPQVVESFQYWTGVEKSNFENAYIICAITPAAQIAREFNVSNNIGDIAAAYADGYTEPSRIAAEQGCLGALIDSPAERDAAIKMMEAAAG